MTVSQPYSLRTVSTSPVTLGVASLNYRLRSIFIYLQLYFYQSFWLHFLAVLSINWNEYHQSNGDYVHSTFTSYNQSIKASESFSCIYLKTLDEYFFLLLLLKVHKITLTKIETWHSILSLPYFLCSARLSSVICIRALCHWLGVKISFI